MVTLNMCASFIVLVYVCSQPHLFGAILNRDQALQAILDQALIVGCDWSKETHFWQPSS